MKMDMCMYAAWVSDLPGHQQKSSYATEWKAKWKQFEFYEGWIWLAIFSAHVLGNWELTVNQPENLYSSLLLKLYQGAVLKSKVVGIWDQTSSHVAQTVEQLRDTTTPSWSACVRYTLVSNSVASLLQGK